MHGMNPSTSFDSTFHWNFSFCAHSFHQDLSSIQSLKPIAGVRHLAPRWRPPTLLFSRGNGAVSIAKVLLLLLQYLPHYSKSQTFVPPTSASRLARHTEARRVDRAASSSAPRSTKTKHPAQSPDRPLLQPHLARLRCPAARRTQIQSPFDLIISSFLNVVMVPYVLCGLQHCPFLLPVCRTVGDNTFGRLSHRCSLIN